MEDNRRSDLQQLAARAIAQATNAVEPQNVAAFEGDLLEKPVDEMTEKERGELADMLFELYKKKVEESVKVEVEWNEAAHGHLAIGKLKWFGSWPVWLDGYPEHIKRAFLLGKEVVGDKTKQLEFVAERIGADLTDPLHLRIVTECFGIVAQRTGTWPQDVGWGATMDCVGWDYIWGRVVSSSEAIDKAGKPFSVVGEVRRTTKPVSERPKIRDTEYRVFYRAELKGARAQPEWVPIEEFLKNPLNYNAGGSAGVKVVGSNGVAYRVSKGGVLMALGYKQMLNSMLHIRNSIVYPSLKLDRKSARVIYTTPWEVYVAFIWVNKVCGIGNLPGTAVGQDALENAAVMENMFRTKKLVVSSTDVKGFDSLSGNSVVLIFLGEWRAEAVSRSTAIMVAQVDLITKEVIRSVKNTRVILREEDKNSELPWADLLFSGWPWTSKFGSCTSRLYAAKCAVVTGAGNRVGTPESMGDDVINTSTNSSVAAAQFRAAKELQIDISLQKTLIGKQYGVFLLLYKLGESWGKPAPRIVCGALVERNPEGTDVFGYAQLSALVNTAEDACSRCSDKVRAAGALRKYLRNICIEWGIPYRAQEAVQQGGGLGIGNRMFRVEQPKVDGKAKVFAPLVDAATKVVVGMVEQVSMGIVLSDMERVELAKHCVSLQTSYVISSEYDRQLHDAAKKADRECQFRVWTMGDKGKLKVATDLATGAVKRALAFDQPLKRLLYEAKKTNLARAKDSKFSNFVFDALKSVYTKAAEVKDLYKRCFPIRSTYLHKPLQQMNWKAFAAVYIDGVSCGVDLDKPLGTGVKIALSSIMNRALVFGVRGMNGGAMAKLTAGDIMAWSVTCSDAMRSIVYGRASHVTVV